MIMIIKLFGAADLSPRLVSGKERRGKEDCS
jgi:hypothetical protein